MQRLFSAKPLLAIALALGGLAAASAAHARSDVVVFIGVQPPVRYVQPAPVYVQHAPVYVQPRPVYVQPRPVYGPHRSFASRGPWGDADRDGVPNRYDRAPGNPYRH